MQYIIAIIAILILIPLGIYLIIKSRLFGLSGTEVGKGYDKRLSFFEKRGLPTFGGDKIRRYTHNLSLYVWGWRIAGIICIVFAISIGLIFFI
jgi:hypothetical protein